MILPKGVKITSKANISLIQSLKVKFLTLGLKFPKKILNVIIMITITISDTFTKGQIIRQPVRCRTSNKEKSDLSPLNHEYLKPIVGQSKGCVIVGKGQIKGISLVKRQLNKVEGYVLRDRLHHKFVGSYTFERLTSRIEKDLRRDLMALVLQKAKQVTILIEGLQSGNYTIQRDNCTDYNNLFNKLRNILLINQKSIL